MGCPTRTAAVFAAAFLVLVACSSPIDDAASATQPPTAQVVDTLPSIGLEAASRTMPVPTATAEPADAVAAAGEAGSSREPGVEQPSPDATTPTVTAPASSAAPAAQPSWRAVHTLALDPGHGGPEVGAANGNLAEKDVNLQIALKLSALLRDRDIAVVLTRDSDRAVSPEYTGGGYPGVGRDLQARVDIANAANADLFISIHNNGSNDPSLSGTEIWYSGQREFAAENERFARLALASLVKSIRALDYPVASHGIKDDANFRTFQGRVYNIFVLGPGNGARPHAPTAMPGILGETLFLSNPGDAARLRQERTLEAIAVGYCDAVIAYFAGER